MDRYQSRWRSNRMHWAWLGFAEGFHRDFLLRFLYFWFGSFFLVRERHLLGLRANGRLRLLGRRAEEYQACGHPPPDFPLMTIWLVGFETQRRVCGHAAGDYGGCQLSLCTAGLLSRFSCDVVSSLQRSGCFFCWPFWLLEAGTVHGWRVTVGSLRHGHCRFGWAFCRSRGTAYRRITRWGPFGVSPPTHASASFME